MIITVKKCLIYGVKGEMDHFFNAAQKAGFIEFISRSLKKAAQLPTSVRETISAIKILKHQPDLKDKLHEEPMSEEIAISHILHLQSALDEYLVEQKVLVAEIARIAPFGNFSKEDIAFIEKNAKRTIQFFCIPVAKAKKVKLPEELIYVATEYDLQYFLAINEEKKSYPNMMEIFIEKSLDTLHERLKLVNENIQKKEAEIKPMRSYLSSLQQELFHRLNTHHLESAKNDVLFPLEDSIFFIEAWVPDSHMDHFHHLIEKNALHFELIAEEKMDRVPTCMENKGLSKLGEDLVNIYDVPSTSDHDPSLWVFSAFALFFAVIVSDAGYGFLYLLLALFMKWKIPSPKAALRRFNKLIFLLSFVTMLWGVISGSFFGVSVNPDSPFAKATLLNDVATKKASYHLRKKDEVYHVWVKEFPKVASAKNGEEFLDATIVKENDHKRYAALDQFKNDLLMEFALFLGVVHIALSLLRNIKKHIAGIGWVIAMVGGYLYLPSFLDATSIFICLGFVSKTFAFTYGSLILYIGIAISVLLALIQNKFRGIGEITNIVQIFSDILSYMRLYALALASMILASTFNDMATNMGLGIGWIVLLIGHTINIGLGIMGGVIHGLRLNFIEWYHYSFEGNGKLFNPLRLLK